MSLLIIRDVAPNSDLPYLLDIDVKCFECPYPTEAWRFLATESYIKVATYNHSVVGFAVYQFESDEESGSNIVDTLHVGKIAVKEQYRNMRVGTKLMNCVLQHAKEQECRYIRCRIAEHMIFNDPSRKLLRFMQRWGFEATGMKQVYTFMDGEKVPFQMYGEEIHSIEFQKDLHADKSRVLGENEKGIA